MKTEKPSLLFGLPGHLFFIAYIGMSIAFTQERIIFSDSAHFLFEMINNEWFNIAHHRYTSGIIQALPVLLINLKAPLPVVAASFSAAFSLFFYACFLISYHGLKKPVAAYCLPFFISMTVGEAFFTPIADMNLLMGGLCLYMAYSEWLLERENRKWWLYIPLVLIFILSLRSHPLALVLIPFVMVWPLLKPGFKEYKRYLPYALIFIAIVVLEKILVPSNGYDQSLMTKLLDSVKNPSLLLDSKIFPFLEMKLETRYGLVQNMIIVSLIITLIAREFLRFVFLLLAIAGYVALIAGAYYSGDSLMMLDKNFMPLAIFACVPFIYYLLQRFYSKPIQLITIAVLGYLSLDGMSEYTDYYESRIVRLNKIKEAMPQRKMLLNQSITPQPELRSVWALAPEMMLLSAWNDPNECKNLYSVRDHSIASRPVDIPDKFWNTPFFGAVSQSTLNPTYFTLPVEPYTILTPEDMEGI